VTAQITAIPSALCMLGISNGGDGRSQHEVAIALHAACRRAPQILEVLVKCQGHLQQLERIDFKALTCVQLQNLVTLMRTWAARRQESLAAALQQRGWCRSEQFVAQLEAMRQQLDFAWRQLEKVRWLSGCFLAQAQTRIVRIDRVALAVLTCVAVRGSKYASVAFISGVALKTVAELHSQRNAFRLSLLILVAARLPTIAVLSLLAALKRVSGTMFGQQLTNVFLQHLPSIALKVALAYAAVSNPELATFAPQPAFDAQRLRALLRPTSPGIATNHAHECFEIEPCYSESFGLFTLVTVPNPLALADNPTEEPADPPHLATGNDSDRNMEILLCAINDVSPSKLYYIGAYDKWVCVNVGAALSTLHALRSIVITYNVPQRIVWKYWARGLPPPDYLPYTAEDQSLACAICLEHRKDTLMRPCGHLCVCWRCSQNVQGKCPVCRGRISAVDYIGMVYP